MGLEDDFCDIIKKSRFGQGLGLGTVADSSNISPSDLEQLEKGHRLPTKPEIQALGQTLHLRGTPLIHLTLDGWVPNPQPEWTIEDNLVETVRGEISGYEVKGYLLTDPVTQHALMIDTGYNANEMLARLRERELKLVGVALTHGHADHAGASLRRGSPLWPAPDRLGNRGIGQRHHPLGDVDRSAGFSPVRASLKSSKGGVNAAFSPTPGKPSMLTAWFPSPPRPPLACRHPRADGSPR